MRADVPIFPAIVCDLVNWLLIFWASFIFVDGSYGINILILSVVFAICILRMSLRMSLAVRSRFSPQPTLLLSNNSRDGLDTVQTALRCSGYRCPCYRVVQTLELEIFGCRTTEVYRCNYYYSRVLGANPDQYRPIY